MGWMLWCVCLSIGGGILLLLINRFYLGGIRSDYRGSFLKDREVFLMMKEEDMDFLDI